MEEKILIEDSSAKSRTTRYLICMIIGLLVAVYLFTSNPNDIIIRAIPDIVFYVLFIGSLIFALYNIVMLLMSKCSITVSTHRVYGKSIKAQVDLPLDSITAIKMGWFKSVIVASPNGAIKFYLLDKQQEIYNTISKLLKERQHKQSNSQTTIIKENMTPSNAEELKKYKDLYDSGAISEEEYNAKKKQLLGL